jgi:hypothetical protein
MVDSLIGSGQASQRIQGEPLRRRSVFTLLLLRKVCARILFLLKPQKSTL